MKLKGAVAIVVAALLVVGCGKEKDKQDIPKPFNSPLSSVDKRLVEASNAFGFRMLQDISKSKPETNRFVSPISISTALALVYNGAAGESKEAMGKAMGINEFKLDDLNNGYRDLIHRLRRSDDGGNELSVANSLWMREGKTFHDSFVQRAKDNYNAEATELDFKSPNAVQKMNEWVEQHTNGKITDIVKDIDAEAMLFVVNAVYFQGAWSEPFQPGITKKADFYSAKDQSFSVDMMARGGHFEYFANSDYEAIKLPFGKDESAFMTVFLPSERTGLSQLQEKLARDPKLVSMPFEVRQGSIELPKVKFEYQIELNDALKSLGMEEAFDQTHGNFSLMAPEPPNLYIGSVKHKTFLDMNEQGTVAAAATVVEMLAGAAQPEDPFRMTVNRPFLLTITDKETGCILFIGTVTDPTG
ncbi:serpin family protein [Cohnella mopanensis]|uniref:serpin family protein n=1 Tax=Cohnella mopanensis TaxID=2911966 RepID=UPI001EF84EA5|nr:serpin family protein [Cohnella mopanensis]